LEECQHGHTFFLVRVVLTSQAIYHITPDLSKEVIIWIIALLQAYFWAGCDKVTSGKCKVNREKVCRPKKLERLEILHLEKFIIVLRLCCIWLEWVDETKEWIGSGNP
jgi:hypothetical protein